MYSSQPNIETPSTINSDRSNSFIYSQSCNNLQTEYNSHPEISYFIYASKQVSATLVLTLVSQVH
jgi:hypothetical protein